MLSRRLSKILEVPRRAVLYTLPVAHWHPCLGRKQKSWKGLQTMPGRDKLSGLWRKRVKFRWLVTANIPYAWPLLTPDRCANNHCEEGEEGWRRDDGYHHGMKSAYQNTLDTHCKLLVLLGTLKENFHGDWEFLGARSTKHQLLDPYKVLA